MNNGNKVGSSCLLDCLLECNSFSFIFPCDCIGKSPVISEFVMLFIRSFIHSFYSVFSGSLFLSFICLLFVRFCMYGCCFRLINVTSNFSRQMENFMLHFKHAALELLMWTMNVSVDAIAICSLFSHNENFMARVCSFFPSFSSRTCS